MLFSLTGRGIPSTQVMAGNEKTFAANKKCAHNQLNREEFGKSPVYDKQLQEGGHPANLWEEINDL